jgi:hypothetical protein
MKKINLMMRLFNNGFLLLIIHAVLNVICIYFMFNESMVSSEFLLHMMGVYLGVSLMTTPFLPIY